VCPRCRQPAAQKGRHRAEAAHYPGPRATYGGLGPAEPRASREVGGPIWEYLLWRISLPASARAVRRGLARRLLLPLASCQWSMAKSGGPFASRKAGKSAVNDPDSGPFEAPSRSRVGVTAHLVATLGRPPGDTPAEQPPTTVTAAPTQAQLRVDMDFRVTRCLVHESIARQTGSTNSPRRAVPSTQVRGPALCGLTQPVGYLVLRQLRDQSVLVVRGALVPMDLAQPDSTKLGSEELSEPDVS
jgi:hypothetical protein